MKRMQLQVSDSRFDELQELMRECGIEQQKDLFNNALALFEWAVNERRKGRIVASVDEENKRYKEISMVALEHAARPRIRQAAG